jgi:hypothetical protein
MFFNTSSTKPATVQADCSIMNMTWVFLE